MTHNSTNELTAIGSQLCTCPLCNGDIRQPAILECFHTFCSDCIQLYISQKTSRNGQRSVSCPVCSWTTSLPEDTSQRSGAAASGGQRDTFTARLSEAARAFRDDAKCDICLQGKADVVASDWCMDCYVALCEKCVKAHLCGKGTRDHALVALSELRKMAPEDMVRRAGPRTCPQHSEELVKLYCLDCGQLVCVQCLAQSHKMCQKCLAVSEARQLVQGDILEVMASLRRMTTSEVSGQDSGRNLTTASLNDSIRQAESDIRSLADELRAKITHCETALLERLRVVSAQTMSDKIQKVDTPQPGDDYRKILPSAQTRMAAVLKYGSDAEILDTYHSIKDVLSKVDAGASQTGSGVSSHLIVTFDIDDKVKNFRRDLEALGDISVEDATVDKGFSSWGVTVTPRDEIIVADGRNKRIQKFISTGLLIDHIQLSEEPRDLTSFGQSDVAITVRKRQILIVDATGNLELKRSLQTQKQYDGIAFTPTFYTFLVSSLEERCIDVITTTGEVTKTCQVDTSSLKPLFGSPRYVAITRDGRCVVSDTTHNSVICLSQDGAQVFTYAPTDRAHALKKAQGVCCDKNGNIFVADYGNARIHLLTPDGSFQRLLYKDGFILGRDTELCRPVAMAMTQTNKLVVVQSDGIVKIFTYEGNTSQEGGQAVDNGKRMSGRSRIYSSATSSLPRDGVTGRRKSESSDPRSSMSSLSPHTFRSRHF